VLKNLQYCGVLQRRYIWTYLPCGVNSSDGGQSGDEAGAVLWSDSMQQLAFVEQLTVRTAEGRWTDRITSKYGMVFIFVMHLLN
jgi:hypothetical protein